MNLDQDPRFQADSKYLKADDMKGKTVTVEIASVGSDEFEDGTDHVVKLILNFVGKEKGLVLNWTNLKKLKAAFGPETDGWVGKSIMLSTTYYDAFGKHGFVVLPAPEDDADVAF